ncbi:MAG TPA: phosphotransferase [Acidimicrobiia bacterium]|nr:phosphotransferase [Acidimicrobiia bacterium]
MNPFDPLWLSETLAAGGRIGPSDRIVAVEATRIGEGSGIGADLHRLTLTLDDSTCFTVVAKLPMSGPLRPLAEATGIYDRELLFYCDLAARCPLPAPRAFFAGRAEQSTDFALLLEDLAANPQLTAADQVSGLDSGRLAALVPTLAGFHAWSAGAGADLEAVIQGLPMLSEIVAPIAGLVPTGWAKYLEVSGAAAPPEADRLAREYPALVAAMAAALDEQATLVHGDFRADNFFFHRDGSVVVIDFQMISRAHPVVDLAYLLSQSLRHPLDRDDQRALVDRYCGAARRAGSAGVDPDEVWLRYRIAVAWYLFIPALAMMTWDVANERGRAMNLTLMERAVTAIGSVGAIEAVTTFG